MRPAQTHMANTEGEGAREAGFTLIELMVVLLIIAILLAIAIPTFLGVTNTAGDRAAQSNLTNALTEAKALYQVNQSYSGNSGAYTTANFTSQAPEFTWEPTATPCTSAIVNCINFKVFDVTTTGDGQGLSLAAYSAKTGTCWYAFDVESTPIKQSAGPLDATFPTAGTWYGKKTSATSCTALLPDGDSGVSFTSTNGQNYSNAAAVS
jgi:type IV pilus assembly protein PilA